MGTTSVHKMLVLSHLMSHSMASWTLEGGVLLSLVALVAAGGVRETGFAATLSSVLLLLLMVIDSYVEGGFLLAIGFLFPFTS